MPKTNDDTSQSALHSSEEAHTQATQLKELSERLTRLESAFQLFMVSGSGKSKGMVDFARQVYSKENHPDTPTAEQQQKQRLLHQLDEWLADDSGYDEETWPKLKAALEQDRLSSRSRFDE